MTPPPPRNVRVFRIVAAAWLLGWFWKAWFFAGYYFSETLSHPFRYDGLPRFLVHPAVAAVVWVSPLLVVAALVWPRPRLMRGAAALMTVAALLGCLHFEMFSDATFVTSFWVGVWLVWFTGNADRADPALYRHARALAACVVGLVFLGGAFGKLSTEYTGGEALYQLYFVQKHSWPYPWLRETLSASTLRDVATWFSRIAITVEIVMALCPLLPFRFTALFGTAVMATMIAVSTSNLLSVLACLIGLLLALLRVDDQMDFGHAG